MSTLYYKQKNYLTYYDELVNKSSEIKKLTTSLNTVSLEDYDNSLKSSKTTTNTSYIEGNKVILSNKKYISEGIEVYEDNEEDSEDDHYINHNKYIENETNDNDNLATSSSNEIYSEDKVDSRYYNDEFNEDENNERHNYGDFYDQGGDYFYYNNGDDYGINEGFNIFYYRGHLIECEDYENNF